MARRLGVALALSATATAGTAYYMLSDGGDPEVAQHRVDKALATVLEPISSGGAPSSSSIGDDGKGSTIVPAANGVNAGCRGAVATSGKDASEVSQSGRRRTVISPFPERNLAREESEVGGCHTCSGPRLWFYAEKFGATRIRRRIGPEPDV